MESMPTSGGLGGLINLLKGKINKLSYETLRYKGHYEAIKKYKLKEIYNLPWTNDDIVYILAIVKFRDKGKLWSFTYEKIIKDKYINVNKSVLANTTAMYAIDSIEELLHLEIDKIKPGMIYQETLF